MYYSTDAITGFLATATDGSLGKVLGFGFDDQTWDVSHVIVRAAWLPSHIAMVDPKLVDRVDGATKQIYFNTTKGGLRREPDIHDAPPVHKLEESVQGVRENAGAQEQADKTEATHLRNSSEVIGYKAIATDRDAGKVSDVIVDTLAWRVHELVVQEGWLLRTHRAVAPHWVDSIDWTSQEVKLCVNRAAVRGARAFNRKAAVNTTRELRVVDYSAKTRLQERDEVSS